MLLIMPPPLHLCFVVQPQEELHLLLPEVLPSGHHFKLQTLPFPKCHQFKTVCSDFTQGLGHCITAYYRKPQLLKENPFLKNSLTNLTFRQFSMALSSIWSPASFSSSQDPPLTSSKCLFISSVEHFTFLSASSSSLASPNGPFSSQNDLLRQLVS